MTETREKVEKPGWRDRLPLIERAVGSIQPGEEPKRNGPPVVPPAAHAVAQGTVPARAPTIAPRVDDKKTLTARQSRYAEIDLKRLEELGILTPKAVRSRIKEELRVIKRGILQHAFSQGPRHGLPGNLIMVTSAKPNEGKTFAAINLAMSIALERDYTVLLIDGDFAHPSVMRTLGLESDKGMVDVLEDPSIDLADVMIRTNVDKLSVLPAGISNSLSTELLASHRMSAVVSDIAQRYHDRVVIFDAPPILATSEPSVLAMHVGQVIMVVEAGKTPKSAVKEALDMIDTGARVGVVLNRCTPRFGQAQFGSYYNNGES